MRTYVKVIIMLLGFFLFITPLTNVILADDTDPPFTLIYFDSETGYITLVGGTYPLDEPSRVVATYYTIDGGGQQTYSEPFFIGEGEHIINYWSVDIDNNVEAMHSRIYFFDGSPPIVEFTHPEPGLYLLGNKLLPLSNNIICIGKVPITVDAYDETSGVKQVFFNIGNDTGYDAKSPFEYTYRDTSSGDLTITAYAEDNYGRISETIEMTITCYSLGLL